MKDYASDIKDAMVTDRTNWQRRQNQNNNFSAVVPYDMELQRKESKEFLDDLTTRDQRMMFAVLTMVLTADSKKQLDADTETILSVARKNMCQMAVLKFQQLDGLNTVLQGAQKDLFVRNDLRELHWPWNWRGAKALGMKFQMHSTEHPTA